MYYHIQSQFEQLHALLNFAPEAMFTSVGEVRDHLALTYQNIKTCDENVIGALGGLTILADTSNRVGVSQDMALGTYANLAALISDHGSMVRYCLERDVIAMETFLDLAAGADARMN